jgi:hypothetical protein
MKVLSNLSLYGTLGLNSVVDANTDTDKFLVIDSNGIVKYRTGQELYNDIGAGGAAAYTSVLQHEVKAGVALTKGQAVYVTSADGTNMIVGKASNASEATSSKTLGLLVQNLAINDIGFVVTEGLLAGLDTSTALAGDPVWLGTDGNLIFGLSNKPYAPAHLVFIGIVTRVQQNNGEIFVKVQNGFELNEIHNVQITSTPSDNTVLAYETSTSLYKMKSIPTLLGYTPTTNARTLTINGTSYDLSADRSWSVGTHTGNLTTGYVPKATGATTLTDSIIYDNGSGIGINTASPYDSANFKLDVNGGVIIKNTSGTLAQLILINSNPATGGNNGFVQFTAGGNTATAFAELQSYYGLSVASGALRLQPAGGQVLIGTRTASAFTTDINGTLRVSGQLTLGSTISNNTYVYTMPGASGTLALVSQIPSLSGYVQTSRTLTINGVSYDLSADRSWSITAGVSSVQAGSGISVSTSGGVATVSNTGLLSGTAGSGISVSTSGGTLSISNTGLLSASAGSGISVSTSGGTLSISNTGLLSALAGSGISVSTSGGSLSISNTGILSILAGSGISVSTSGGTTTITNTITNTNQLTNGAGYITGITSSMVTSALGYTPYNSSNPNGYITSSALSSYLPLSGGTMSGIIAFSNVTGNKIDFYHTTTGSGDRYGIQVQSSELRIHSGAAGASTGGITFGKSDTTTFTEHLRIRNDGIVQVNSYLRTSGVTSNTVFFSAGTNSVDFGNALGQGTSSRSTYFRGNTDNVSVWWGGVDGNGNNIPYGAIDATAGQFTFWRNSGGTGGGDWTNIMTMNASGLTMVNGNFIGSLIGNASTASTATNVAWTGVSAGIRENYDLQFRPADNSSSYAGLSFASPGNSQNGGYFLIRGGADNDVYTQNGITLVADLGWLTLAQRTTASRGVRIMTGSSTSTERARFLTDGQIQFLNGTGFTYNGNTIWHQGNLTNLNQLTNGPGYITGYTETDTLASVTGRGASTSTLSNFNAGLTSAKTSKTAYSIHIKGGFYGAPRLQLYDLAVDGNAFVGLGVDMSGAAYEFSNYFPRYAGSGKWSVGSWAGDFGTGQYVSGYNEKFWITENAAAFNISVTVNGTMRFTDTTNGIYKSGDRLTIRSESTDNVANFANYGLYLPVMSQTAGLYVESPIEARGGLRMGSGASNGTITVGADTGATANRLVQRDGGGDIYSRYSFAIHFNASCPNNENPSIAAIWTNSGADNYLRKSTPAHLISQLGLITTSNIGSQSVNNSSQLNGLSKIQLWNNSGQNHEAYQSFAAIPNFGVWFMQNSSPSDTPQSASQYYVQTQGLGNQYPYGTGTPGAYALMTAVARDHALKYTYYRTLENGNWGSWTKAAAGYADTAGSLSSMNISQFTNNSGYVTTSGLSTDTDSEQQAGLRYLNWNEGIRRMNTDPRWNESGYDGDLGCLHIWAFTSGGVPYGRAGIALYNGSDYQYLTTKASTSGIFVNNSLILTTGNYNSYALPLSGGSLSGDLGMGGSRITYSTYNAPNMIVAGSGDNNWTFGSFHDGGSQYWMQVKFYGTGDDSRGFRILDVNGGTVRFRVNGAGNAYANNNLILTTANYSSYALTTGGGTVTGTILSSFDNSWALRINRSSTSNYLGITYATGGALQWYLGPREDGTHTYRFYNFATTLNTWSIDVNGNCTASGDITAFSDARVKTNVKTIENALNKVLGLRGVSYNRTDSQDKKTKIGVIAQETLPIVPEVVNQENDGMYSVSYGNFGGLFIEAFKEQQQQIKAQAEQISELKSIINALTK